MFRLKGGDPYADLIDAARDKPPAPTSGAPNAEQKR